MHYDCAVKIDILIPKMILINLDTDSCKKSALILQYKFFSCYLFLKQKWN